MSRSVRVNLSRLLYPALCVLFLLVTSLACLNRNASNGIHRRTQFLLGTVVEVTAVSNDPVVADAAISSAFQRMRDIEAEMSARLPGNQVDRIGKHAGKGPVRVSMELLAVIETCQRYSALTHGAFDITIAPVTRLWKFDAPTTMIPSAEDVNAALSLVGFEMIHFDSNEGTISLDRPGMGLDLGGAAKGYAVDEAVRRLKESGITAGIVNAGGDLRCFGMKPDGTSWHIGIQDPRHQDRIIGSILLDDMALVTSGDYERYIVHEGVRYHHIIDPKTGWPAQGCMSVSVASASALDADILSTAIFVLGPQQGMEILERLPGIDGMIVDANGRVSISSGWQKRFRLHGGPSS
ncbi:MAG: FAD:protein FMN transferase [bacterium]